MQHILNKVFIGIGLLTILLLGSSSSVIYAQNCSQPNLSAKQAIQCGTNGASATGQGSGQAQTDVNSTIAKLINLFSAIGGILAVIMLIFGGIRYTTSAGDTNKVGVAKNTIIYAVIGLIIVALAQVIARFVLHKAAG